MHSFNIAKVYKSKTKRKKILMKTYINNTYNRTKPHIKDKCLLENVKKKCTP